MRRSFLATRDDALLCCMLMPYVTMDAPWTIFQVLDSLKQGHQAMVFVHSRKDTGKTARTLVIVFSPQLFQGFNSGQ